MDTESLRKQGAVLLAQSGGCAVWQFCNEAGEGTMTTYEVFPGVMLGFNDFHMEYFESRYVADRRLLAIDHCREGRMEYSPGNDRLAYTAAGDMKLDLRQQHTGTFVFPSHHYHGLTVAFDRDIVQRSLPQEVRDFPVTPETVIARWELGACPRVVHGAEAMERIFGELYRVPEQIRIPYFKVKILELLLCLDAMPIPAEGGDSLLLPDPGGKGQGHPRLPPGACGGELHPGGALPPLRHLHDPYEDLLPLRLWDGHRHLAHPVPHGSCGGAAAAAAGAQHRGDRRAGGLRQRGKIHGSFQAGDALHPIGVSKGARDPP